MRNTFKMFGEDRVIFISDTMEAAGLEDGMYELGGQPVIVKETVRPWKTELLQVPIPT